MVKYCKFALEEDCCKCQLCGFVICNSKLPIHRQCDAEHGKSTSNQKAGSELKSILKDWLGIEATPTCSCNAMARRMNTLGPEWCESDEGMASILDVMRTEHAKRRAAGTTILPWTDLGARQLVLLACRRARATG
jgi:hypothetical protein